MANFITKLGRQLGLSSQKLPSEQYQSADPYGADAPQWDENGMPIGRMPRGQYALDYQYEGNRRAEARRQTLWGDAQNSLRQGADLLQSYRPGGSAALASGIYQQKASLYGTQALNHQAPDLLMGYREHRLALADRERKQQVKIAKTVGIVSSIGSFFGGSASGGAAPEGAGKETIDPGQPAGQTDQGGIIQPGGATQSSRGATIAQPSAIGAPQDGGYDDGGGAGAGGGRGGSGPGNPGGAYDSRLGPESSGAYGAGGGGAGGGPSPGGPGGSGGKPAPGGGGAGGYDGSGGMVMGDAPMANFSSGEAAANSMASTPGTGSVVYPEWADDETRQRSTYMIAAGARQRLNEAMAG